MAVFGLKIISKFLQKPFQKLQQYFLSRLELRRLTTKSSLVCSNYMVLEHAPNISPY